MKLYFTKGACSLASRIIINELGLPCEYESVDLVAKKTASGEDFLKINPKGAVPAFITDDGETLTENAVIQQYLAEKAHATHLLPPIGDFKRYRVLEWLNFIATDFHKICGLLFKPDIPQEVKDNVFIPLVKNRLTYINHHLQKNQYLLGEVFTLPDAYLLVMLNWTKYFKFNLTEWPSIDRYYTELKLRPSIQRSLHEEGML